MAPLFEHYSIQLWTPEVGGRIDFHAEDHQETLLAQGLGSTCDRTACIFMHYSLRKERSHSAALSASAPGEPWESCYARQILRHFRPSGS